MTEEQIRQFHENPKNIKDPNVLTEEIEKQSIEIRYRFGRKDMTVAFIKSQFVLDLANRLEELMKNEKEIEVS